ncbi:MAG: FKBP-type peptidyl-prolyl cis-trans isomerase [Clostridia bacterium]|nr:FKBP-type peptidyl-prolyl cis-trans isomerase [Clostridia bacterium]
MKKGLCLLLALCLLFAACSKTETGTETGASASSDGSGSAEQPGTASQPGTGPAVVSDADFDYKTSDLSKYVRIQSLEGLAVTRQDPALTDEEYANEVDAMLESYSYYPEITDRPVEEGDTVLADYSGYLDGEPFAGGTAQNQKIVAQGGTGYINGFAEAFIGRMPDGEEFSFNVTFPENYGSDELNGQEVTFVCRVHAIVATELVVPELNDEFVTSHFAYANVEEFNKAYRENVQWRKNYYVDGAMYSELWEQVLQRSEVLMYPEEEVERVYRENRAQYEYYAQYFQVDYDTLLQAYYGITDEDVREESKGFVKEDLVMYACVKELGIEPTEEEYREGMKFYAQYNGMELDEFLNYYSEDVLRTSVLWQQLIKEIIERYATVTQEGAA